MFSRPEIALLTRVLGRTDALFSAPRVYTNPCTCLPNPAWAATVERRADFPSRGIEFKTPGTAAEAKASERRLGGLQAAGYITIDIRGGRRAGVRLTQQGDTVARYFAAETMLREAWPVLERIGELIRARVCLKCLVREDDLAAVDYGSDGISRKLSDLEMDLLPLKAAGLVDDTADSEGRVWYNLTPAGVRALSGERPTEPDDLPPYESGWCDEHTELHEHYLAERLTWKPQRPGHVIIPVPCGVGPERTWKSLVRRKAEEKEAPRRPARRRKGGRPKKAGAEKGRANCPTNSSRANCPKPIQVEAGPDA